MKRVDAVQFKEIGKMVAIILAAILACRITVGVAGVALVSIGFIWALSGKLGKALSLYMLLPFFVIMNPLILPPTAVMGIALRLGPLVMTVGLMLAAGRRGGHHALPFGGIFIFIVCAAVSSLGGYAPMISYLKIINFLIMLFGVWFGLKNLHQTPKDVMYLRNFLLAMAVIIVIGSALTIWVPSIGYLNNTKQMLRAHPELSMAEVNALLGERSDMLLFAGVTNQSQCLATLLPVMLIWIVCDMLFVEKRFSKLHSLLILIGLPLIYMTRSRTALCTTFAATIMVYFYCIRVIPIKPKLRRALQSGMSGALALLVVVSIVSEIKSQAFTRWLRKTDNLASDSRSMSEAVTGSRQGLIAESMHDFHQNPMFGKGFQVMAYMSNMSGFQLSAPIEKGVLPIMILGETGVVGFIAFIIFLVTFYGGCVNRKYVVTMTLFTALIATNFGEADFFSAGGVGGTKWIVCLGGGFVIDTIVLYRRNLERSMARFG